MKLFFIVTLLAFASLLAKAQNDFVVTGKFSTSTDGSKITLYYTNMEGKSAQDSTRILNGQFIIRNKILAPAKVYVFMIHPKKDDLSKSVTESQYFFLDKGNTTITGTDKISDAKINGGKSQQEYLLLQSQTGALLKRMAELTEQFRPLYAAKKDTVAMKKISAEARPLMEKINALQDAFILSHPDSYVSLDLLTEKIQVINLETFLPFYNPMSKEVLSSPLGKKITDRLNLAMKTAMGKPFDFTQADDKGNPFTLSSLKGKYVLVDFWASWCGPCRQENPNVVRAYNKYKDKNFEIVSISLDDNKTAWLNAVKKDGLNWIHVSDLKGWKNQIAIDYGITAVPQNFLVDPNGIIIAANLRGEELEKKLAAIIK